MSDNLQLNERTCVLNWAYGLAGHRDSSAGAWRFAYTGHAFEDDVRAARDEWLTTADHADRGYDSCPNWGDFVTWCPTEIMARHGLRFLPDAPDDSFTVDHDETFELPEERFLTITVVIRAPGDIGRDEIDPSVIRQLVTDDETMWFGTSIGVTEAAIAGGADPTSWAYED